MYVAILPQNKMHKIVGMRKQKQGLHLKPFLPKSYTVWNVGMGIELQVSLNPEWSPLITEAQKGPSTAVYHSDIFSIQIFTSNIFFHSNYTSILFFHSSYMSKCIKYAHKYVSGMEE